MNFALDPNTLDKFDSAAERYVGYKETDPRKPQNFNFFEARPTIDMTKVTDLWASARPVPDDFDDVTLEVWLQPAAEPRFREVLEELDLKARPALQFQDARVLLVRADILQFERLARSASIGQLRPASALAGEVFQLPAGVQAAAVAAAARRVTPAAAEAPAVCILDTGVHEGHLLLQPSLTTSLSVVGGGSADWHGHGTQMAGLALYDDLPGLITNRGTAQPSFVLESVKVHPPLGDANPLATRHPAERVKAAVEAVEVLEDRPRTYCFAMNAPDDPSDGCPSALSSEIDLLASDVAKARLFCVAAGNVAEPLPLQSYTSSNDLAGLMSPAQAWNALTVAACTDLAAVPTTHIPMAPAGDLCPWSTTSVNWERQHKPASKPDVVFEGGNKMVDRVSRAEGPHADLCLLTTSMDDQMPLTLTGMTSAATAAAAGLCVSLQAEYPDLWPETIRGLVAHSAEHNSAMRARARRAARGRGGEEKALLERFGYGKPDRFRAMQNAEDALTLINQAALRPFRLNEKQNGAILGQMRVHQMPWPVEELERLDGVPAELRVTLSYFISPNPGAVIKGSTKDYASHGFDFDVKRPDESLDDAVARINKLYEKPAYEPPVLDWQFGQFRGRGGLKHDRLRLDNAADLARMGGIMVVPQQGWWGSRRELVDLQARYALIVTIKTPEQEIYTPIANAIAI